MQRRTLNLGILAHVDAGKTTLTERLLHAAGVIDEIGSVDKGTTQTDSLPLEQERGITIRSAVVSFEIDTVTVNLIDTPGHPDFIAEVERVLGVLDGVVVVVSAVEGVQSQTRVLMRALERLRIPTLVFVNKVDRGGADCSRVLAEIRRKLTSAAIRMTSVTGEGTRAAAVIPSTDDDAGFRSELVEVLAEHDESLLALYVDDESRLSSRRLGTALAAQTWDALVHPVFFGSALTGAGVERLMAGIAELLPAAAGDAAGPLSGTVFKIERGPDGDRIAYVRMFSGTLRARDCVRYGSGAEAKVTAIGVFDNGTVARRQCVEAGEIAEVWGLREIQIGDGIGEASGLAAPHEFAPPTLESVVDPLDDGDRHALRLALAQLADQDPLIDVRQDDTRREISISLYGDVQKEVVEATLASDYGIAATFRETTPIYVERPIAAADAMEILNAASNPFPAEIGLHVAPLPRGSGVEVDVQVDPRTVPINIYKSHEGFGERMDEYIRASLREGLRGWQVTDCRVTVTNCGYSIADGPPSRRGPESTAADFRRLTPIVVLRALQQGGTAVCEPMMRVVVEIPADAIGAVMAALTRLGADVATPTVERDRAIVEAIVPAVRVRDLQRQLAGLTHGEGMLESSFEGYEPVAGEAPTRRRTTPNPLDLAEYTAQLTMAYVLEQRSRHG